jgi:TRAP-type transport system periplasmic protein
MNRRRSRGYFLATVGTLGVPLARSASAADGYTLRLGTFKIAESSQGRMSEQFAAAVARRSNGQVKIEVYANGVLGKQADVINGLLSGAADFVVIGTGVLAPLAPRLQIFDMPFLFKDMSAGYRVVDGPVGADLAGDLEAKGVLALAWAGSGMREVETVTKVIQTPDDLKGLRIRIQSGAVYVAMFQALGAIPVVTDSSEAYLAVQQHLVDGLDSDINATVSSKFYNVAKHVAMLNQVFAAQCIFGSKRKIDALPAALQRIVKEEAKAIVPSWRSMTDRALAEDTQFLKNNGCTFTEPQLPGFRKAMDPVYAAFQSKPGGDLIERVSRTVSAL